MYNDTIGHFANLARNKADTLLHRPLAFLTGVRTACESSPVMPVPETSPSNALAYRVIRRLVNNFYTRVRGDRVLGAFFLQEITSNAAWDQHLDTMTEFWASLLPVGCG